VRQTSEDIAEILIGIDPPTTAALNDRIEDSGALAGIGITEEEFVFIPDGRGLEAKFLSRLLSLSTLPSQR
jgi:hypothetical protein